MQHVHGDLNHRGTRALAATGLQDPQLTVLYGELEILEKEAAAKAAAEAAAKAAEAAAEAKAKMEEIAKAKAEAEAKKQDLLEAQARYAREAEARKAELEARKAAEEEAKKKAIIATHVVKSGETLSHIALQYYKHATPPYYKLIYEFNKDVIGDNINIIIPGQ
ncbi:MAG: hypothetical protein QM237_11280, partial [Bacteroidota bacterium]|nr:hypothetical protein [Bacteroidota bacterium]